SLGAAKGSEWDWAGAEEEYRKAIALNPNYANAHLFYSGLLLSLGKPDQALAEAKRAIELDPLSLPVEENLGDLYMGLDRFDEAVRQYRAMLEIDPKDISAHFGLSRAYNSQGNYAQGFQEGRQAALVSGDARGIEEWNGIWDAFQKFGYTAAMKAFAE